MNDIYYFAAEWEGQVSVWLHIVILQIKQSVNLFLKV